MNIKEFLTPKNEFLSKSDQKIYDALIKYPSHTQLMTIQKLSADAGTSVASVQRYCKKLGFKGFKEFQFELKNFLIQQKNESTNNKSDFLDGYIQIVNNFRNIDPKIINEFADNLLQARIVYSMGIFYSGLPAKQLSLALRDLGKISFSANDYISASHWNGIANKDDAFVVFSVSGDEANLKKYLSESLEKIDKTYLITFNEDTLLKKYFKHVIVLPGKSFVYNTSIDPQSLVLLFVEMVIERMIGYKKK